MDFVLLRFVGRPCPDDIQAAEFSKPCIQFVVHDPTQTFMKWFCANLSRHQEKPNLIREFPAKVFTVAIRRPKTYPNAKNRATQRPRPSWDIHMRGYDIVTHEKRFRHPVIRGLRRIFGILPALVFGIGIAWLLGSERLSPLVLFATGLYAWLGAGMLLQAIALAFIQVRSGEPFRPPFQEVVFAFSFFAVSGIGLVGLAA